MPSISPNDILRDATPKQLEQAVAENHRELFCLEALAEGGEVHTGDGLTWTYSGPDKNSMIAFPSPEADETGALLDRMMDSYRAHPPKGAGYWSLDPPQPADIGVRLLARGFQPGWAPCWMALDLDNINDKYSCPPALRIQPDNDTAIHHIKDLPYTGDNNSTSETFRRTHPDRGQRFLASLNRKIVGQSAVFFTTGAYGVAGIYNVGVVPAARNKGIGKALTLAACHYAKERGYRYAVLNASGMGRPIYKQTGFQWIGDGLTWWLISKRYITHPPSPGQVAMAEAVGRGDITALDGLATAGATQDLNMPITNGMTWMELAAHCRQPVSAEWLIAHGITYTTLDAWDIGWKDRTAALLAASPQEVNRQYGEGQLTILHTAIQRNDMALAILALSSNPNLHIRDSMYDGTPLGWAQHFGREEMARLIKEQLASQ